MAKQKKEKAFNLEVELKTLASIREICRTIRKFTYVNRNVLTTLKTSKKDIMLKEVSNLTEVINQLT